MNDEYAEKLKELIGALAEGASHAVRVFHYSDPNDFKALWGLDDKDGDEGLADTLREWGCQPDGAGATIVVVWDGMPSEDDPAQLDAGAFTTPYDWAMVASRCIYEKDSLSRCRLRMLILDIRSGQNRKTGFGPLNAAHNALPWVQDYVAVGHEAINDLRELAKPDLFATVRHALPIAARDFAVLLEDTNAPGPVLTTNPTDDREEHRKAIEDVMVPWKDRLRKDDNRHSVANLIGPVVLAAALPPDTANNVEHEITRVSLARRAVVVALKQVGLWPATASDSGGQYEGFLRSEEMDELCQRDIFARLRKIRFCLVDDKFDLGYDRFLASVVFGHNYPPGEADGHAIEFSKHDGHSLRCEPTVDGLLKDLQKSHGAGGIKNWDEPRIFDKCDVLLLDLRLWQSSSDRRRVLARIVKATDEMLNGTLADQVDPDLATALEAARSVVDKGATRGFDFASLALLPLLLTCFDPTLPIVLFSSTQQRRVTDLFREKPNITTWFAKPLAGTAAKNALAQLERSLCEAVKLHERRVVWKRLCSLKPKKTKRDLGWRGPYGNGRYVEGTPPADKRLTDPVRRFTLGEITVYESLQRPWSFLDAWLQEHSEKGQADQQLWISPAGRGRLARALREIGEDMYGSLDQDSFKDCGAREVAVLQFLFLLDFLAGKPRRACGADWAEAVSTEVKKDRDWELVRDVLGRCGRPENGETFLDKETEDAVLNICCEEK